MNRIKSIISNPYFLVVLVYLSAHFFMLLLSGCWWDDWTFMSHNLNYINAVASQSGRPEWNFLIPLCWSLPNNGRIAIFFLYLLDALLVFDSLKRCTLFNEKQSLIISLIFILIPVNEARILISNFAYTVGLFFFYLAFNLFIRWNKARELSYRFVILLLFYISFILNSLMAYYYTLFIYLFILDFKDKQLTIKNIFKSVKNVIANNIDFFLLPFIYLFINKTFFPTYGDNFGNYNSFGVKSIIKACIYIPLSIVNSLFISVLNWVNSISVIATIIMSVGFYYIYKKDYKNKKTDVNNYLL